jgi:hypothetical protein
MDSSLRPLRQKFDPMQRKLEKIRNQYIIDILQLQFDEQGLGKVFLPGQWLDDKIYGNYRKQLLYKLSKKYIAEIIVHEDLNEIQRSIQIDLQLLKRRNIRKEIGELMDKEQQEYNDRFRTAG